MIMIASYLDDGDCIVHKCVTIYDACKKWGQTDGQTESLILQSGRCSPAKHGDAYFSAVCVREQILVNKSDKSDHPHQQEPWCFVEVVNKVGVEAMPTNF